MKLNQEAAEVYFNIFQELKKKYNLSGELEVKDFINLPDLIKLEKEEYDLKKAWKVIAEVTEKALSDINSMRKSEGLKLGEDLKRRVEKLDEVLGKIESLSSQNVENYRQKLQSRISELLGDVSLDEQRLIQEVALLAERSDVTEECVRFRSHNQQFLAALEEEVPVGKKLTFLLQEMNREANTIGAKALNVSISQLVIFLKEEIEKLREQVQNIE